MRKPLIGVLPLWDAEKGHYWMFPGYLDAVMQAGGCPAVLPLCGEGDMTGLYAAAFDGFLFTGGPDVAPSLYNETPSEKCGVPVPLRDTMENGLIQTLIGLDKPVLGICRGIQLINAALGGSLYQDIPGEYPTAVNHWQEPPYSEPVHRVHPVPDTPLAALLRKDTIDVNSHHHQAVKRLSPRLSVMALSEDGLIEAAYMPNRRFVWAVQWHPEHTLWDENSRALFKAFTMASGEKK